MNMFIFDISNPLTLILMLAATALLIFLAQEVKKSYVAAIMLFVQPRQIISAISNVLNVTAFPGQQKRTINSSLSGVKTVESRQLCQRSIRQKTDDMRMLFRSVLRRMKNSGPNPSPNAQNADLLLQQLRIEDIPCCQALLVLVRLLMCVRNAATSGDLGNRREEYG